MEKIRTFIAVPLPPEIIREFTLLVDSLRRYSQGIRWVKPASIHLTMKFLGNLTAGEVTKVFEGMNDVFRESHPEFSLTVGGLGAFPNIKRPRVLWVGMKGTGYESLCNLQSQIETVLGERGFPRENRKFSPHFTVGRIKSLQNIQELMERFTQYPFPKKILTVKRIDVMKSILRPGGAVYSVLKYYNL